MKIGIMVFCTLCKRVKAPRGRSVAALMHGSYCQSDSCIGYDHDPKPGDLWWGETDSDFGYPCSDNATREVEA